MERDRLEIFVLGGPNGSGKSTVAGRLLPDDLEVSNFVNADVIAAEVVPGSPPVSAIDAGRIFLRRIRDLRRQRERFAFESTLASKTFAPFLSEAKAAGYRIHVLYVCLSNSDLAVHRVRLRVERGGHDIPEHTIRRRFTRSHINFFELYRPLANTWAVCDNSGEALVRVAYGREGAEPIIVDRQRWERALRQGKTDAD